MSGMRREVRHLGRLQTVYDKADASMRARALIRLCVPLRQAPTNLQQRPMKNDSGHYFSGRYEVATGNFCGKGPAYMEKITHPSTGSSIAPHSELVEERSSFWVTCRRPSFLHGEDGSIQLFTKFCEPSSCPALPCIWKRPWAHCWDCSNRQLQLCSCNGATWTC